MGFPFTSFEYYFCHSYHRKYKSSISHGIKKIQFIFFLEWIMRVEIFREPHKLMSTIHYEVFHFYSCFSCREIKKEIHRSMSTTLIKLYIYLTIHLHLFIDLGIDSLVRSLAHTTKFLKLIIWLKSVRFIVSH